MVEHDHQSHNSSSGLTFVLRTSFCVTENFNACAILWLCFYLLTVQWSTWSALRYLLRGPPNDGTYDVPKHVDLLTSGVHIFGARKLVI